jgi:hypothetical protein
VRINDSIHCITPLGDQSRLVQVAIVKQLPGISQGSVEAKKVLQATPVAPQHGLLWHIVPSVSHSVPNALNGKFRQGQPKVDQMEEEPLLFQTADPLSECATGQRRFEGKIDALGSELMQMLKHDLACLERPVFWSERRKAARQRVGIHKMPNTKHIPQ